MKKLFFVLVLFVFSIAFYSCNNQTIRVGDISYEIMDYEQQRVPTILQQMGNVGFGRKVTDIVFDSLVLFGCNSINDELSDKIKYSGYFITTWDLETTYGGGNSEQKQVYINVSDITIKKEGGQYFYEWKTDYYRAFLSI